jgi:hypothetical protein
LIVGALVVWAVTVGLFVNYWYRPQITVENAGPEEIRDVRLVASETNGEHERYTAALPPGGRLTVSAPTSDLYLRELSYTRAGRRIEYQGGGIATPGTRLVLVVTQAEEPQTHTEFFFR